METRVGERTKKKEIRKFSANSRVKLQGVRYLESSYSGQQESLDTYV